ncbi:MAG: hypothetical protein ROR55_19840 [Devosia sp.]
MSGLIEEIQRDALDVAVPIEALLKRVKLAAAKLQLGEIESWINAELSGYSDDVPSYREVTGEPIMLNPVNGLWIPILTRDRETADRICRIHVRESVSSLRTVLADKENSTPFIPYGPLFAAWLFKRLDFPPTRSGVRITSGNVAQILDKVRDLVLDWAIKMEAKGVVGDGLSFAGGEISKAQHAMQNIHINNIENMAGNIGYGNQSGDIHFSRSDVGELTQIFENISDAVVHLKEVGVNDASLSALLKSAHAELSNKDPSKKAIKKILEEMKTILSGAAGNVVGAGALALIGRALSLI